MKSLLNLANNKNLEVYRINYRFAGTVNKGFDLVYNDGKNKYIVASFEPVNRIGHKWMIKNYCNNSGITYARNINEACKNILHSIQPVRTYMVLNTTQTKLEA